MLYKKIKSNKLGNDYVVGDIHGMYDLLLQELKDIDFDFNKDRLFSVGDLVDRGSQSLKAFNLITESWFIAVRGNHEQFIVSCKNNTYSEDIHKVNGGDWYYQLNNNTKQTIYDKVQTLPLMIETEVDGKTIGFVHGDITDWDTTSYIIKNLKEENIDSNVIAQQLLWGRTRIKRQNTNICKGIDHVFLGHTPINEKLTLGNCHYIDTAAVFGNKLTILNIKNFINV